MERAVRSVVTERTHGVAQFVDHIGLRTIRMKREMPRPRAVRHVCELGRLRDEVTRVEIELRLAHQFFAKLDKLVQSLFESSELLGVIGPDPLVPKTEFIVKDGHVAPPDGPGLGITVDEKALDSLTLHKESVR